MSAAAADVAKARLRAAPWLKAKPLSTVLAALDADVGLTRIVGGAVRDTLLGRAEGPVEIDLATMLEPEDVMSRGRKAGLTAVPTGIAFGTVTLASGATGFEVTTLRRDVETDGRHAVVRFGDDWTEDAQRRDFTFNALYCGADGTLFDPLGGLKDCLAGRVRFIGDAAQRIAEDRLRVFRFFRFSASHGGERFDAEGLAAAAGAAGDLGRLSAERIGHEMSRILDLPRCATTLGTMAETGILDIGPETLAELKHYEDVAASPGLVGRLTLLAGPDGFKRLQDAWRLSNATIKQAQATGQAADMIGGGRLAEAAYRHGTVLDAATDVAASRSGWQQGRVDDTRHKLHAYAPPAFPVSGAMLVRKGFAAGPELGALLSRLELAWIASEFALTKDDLLAMAAAERT